MNEVTKLFALSDKLEKLVVQIQDGTEIAKLGAVIRAIHTVCDAVVAHSWKAETLASIMSVVAPRAHRAARKALDIVRDVHSIVEDGRVSLDELSKLKQLIKSIEQLRTLVDRGL